MFRNLLYFLSFVCLLYSCDSDESGNPIEQSRQDSTLTKSLQDKRVSVHEPSDIIKIEDGFLVAGTMIGNGGFVIKYNKDLDEVWYHEFDGAINSIAQDHNKGVVIAGEKVNNKPWIAKINSEGNLLWSEIVVTAELQHGGINKVIPLDDGYVIAGWRNTVDSDIYTEALILKLNAEGKFDSTVTCWNVKINGSHNLNYDEVLDIILVEDHDASSGYLVSGTSTQVITGESTWIAKLNDKGEQLFIKDFKNDQGGCKIKSLLETEDGYIGTGVWGNNYLWLIRIDKNHGEVIFNKKYRSNLGFIALGTSLARTQDGGFIVAGYDIGNIPSGWLLRFNNNQMEWFNYLGPVDKMFAINSIVQDDDGTYILAGCLFNSARRKELTVIRTGRDGNYYGEF